MDSKCILNGQTPWCRPLVLTRTIWEEVPWGTRNGYGRSSQTFGAFSIQWRGKAPKAEELTEKKIIHPQASGAIWPWPAGHRAVSMRWVMQDTSAWHCLIVGLPGDLFLTIRSKFVSWWSAAAFLWLGGLRMYLLLPWASVTVLCEQWIHRGLHCSNTSSLLVGAQQYLVMLY